MFDFEPFGFISTFVYNCFYVMYDILYEVCCNLKQESMGKI